MTQNGLDRNGKKMSHPRFLFVGDLRRRWEREILRGHVDVLFVVVVVVVDVDDRIYCFCCRSITLSLFFFIGVSPLCCILA